MNDRCRAAVATKNAAEGSEHYTTECVKCSAIIREEYIAYTGRLKNKLAKLPGNSKQWWQINRELMNNTKPKATIPPLKSGKNWLSEPQSKADCLAKVFRDRCKLLGGSVALTRRGWLPQAAPVKLVAPGKPDKASNTQNDFTHQYVPT